MELASVATPLEFSEVVPSRVVPLKKLTVPVGMPVVAEAIVALMVCAENCSSVDEAEATDALVLALVTESVSGSALLFEAA